VSQSNRAPSSKPDLDEVVEIHGRFVWRVLARLGVASADVPDVCQEVLITVYRRIADFDADRASFRSWLYGICARTASDYRRHARTRREELSDSVPETATPAHQDDDLERRRARAHLDRVLECLDESKREVFVLYELEELSMTEVARALGCPLQTAYSRLHAARKVVEAAFRRFADDRTAL
jgi:RNA polymerase sigma-70 factor (ECF subfamily)